MKKAFLIIIFFKSTILFAQDIKISGGIGYGEYDFNSLKKFQTSLIDYYSPLPIKAVEQFSGYYNYGVSGELFWENLKAIGVDIQYCSTGGRNHLADYSGEYKLDMRLESYCFTVFYKQSIYLRGKFNFYVQLQTGLDVTLLNMDEMIRLINVEEYNNSKSFISKSILIEPVIGSSYMLSSKFLVSVSFGYLFELPTKFHLKENKDLTLNSPKGQAAYSNWSGSRLRVTFSVII